MTEQRISYAGERVYVGIDVHKETYTVTCVCHQQIALQRYLMEYLTQASLPVREIGTVLTLLHARYELEDLIRLDNFQG